MLWREERDDATYIEVEIDIEDRIVIRQGRNADHADKHQQVEFRMQPPTVQYEVRTLIRLLRMAMEYLQPN